MKPHPPNTQGRARRKHRGEEGNPEEAKSHPEEAERRRRKRTETAEERRREGWGGRQGLRCGEANPNQRLRGTSGQKPNADSQRQPYKRPTTDKMASRPRSRMMSRLGGSRCWGWGLQIKSRARGMPVAAFVSCHAEAGDRLRATGMSWGRG